VQIRSDAQELARVFTTGSPEDVAGRVADVLEDIGQFSSAQ